MSSVGKATTLSLSTRTEEEEEEEGEEGGESFRFVSFSLPSNADLGFLLPPSTACFTNRTSSSSSKTKWEA